jgi:hypothetical protein
MIACVNNSQKHSNLVSPEYGSQDLRSPDCSQTQVCHQGWLSIQTDILLRISLVLIINAFIRCSASFARLFNSMEYDFTIKIATIDF